MSRILAGQRRNVSTLICYKRMPKPARQNTLATPPSPLVSIVHLAILLVRAAISRIFNSHSGRKAGGEQPAPPISADAEATSGIHAVEVALVLGAGRANPRRRGRGQDGLLDLAVLFDQLARHHPEHLLDALAALGADLVTRVPPDLLSPESAAPLATRAAGFRCARGCRPQRCRHHRARCTRYRGMRLRGAQRQREARQPAGVAVEGGVEPRPGARFSATYATQASKGTSRRVGSRATISAFVPTTWSTISGGRFRRSSVSHMPISAKEFASVML